MNARFAPMTSANLVLRVLSGRQSGAEYRLQSGITATVGHSFNHDIVLRNRDAKDLSLKLCLREEIAEVTLHSGEASLLGRNLQPGETAQLPPFMPVTIAGMSFAIGESGSDRWEEALQLADLPPVVSEPAEDTPGDDAREEEAEAPGQSAAASAALAVKPVEGAINHFTTRFRLLGERIDIERRWPIFAVVAAGLLLLLAAVGPLVNYVGEQSNGPEAVQAKLARVGFDNIEVTRGENGVIRLTGLLQKDADLERLRQFADQRLDNPDIAVKTMEGMAAAATALLSAEGIDAEARPGRNNALIIESEYLPGDRQAELKQLIGSDMPEVGTVAFQFAQQRGDQHLQYFFSKGSFGLATYVEGDPSYIRTADGTTWFKGAKLPTGHSLIDIGGGTIRFERNGIIEDLVVVTPEEGAAVAGEEASETAEAGKENSV